MTREEAIKKANDKLGSVIYLSECSANPGLRKVYGNMAEWLSRVVHLAEIGLKAQQEAEKNEPLTLDELREMDGEPVYIVFPGHEKCCPGRWEILERAGKWGWNGIHGEYFESNYESMWLAYLHKPKEEITR